jgi:hypothetical protein
MTNDATAALLHRLKRLERQNRLQGWTATFAVILFASLFLMGQTTGSTAPKTIEGESFFLKDSAGKTRAALTVNTIGTVQLALADQAEKVTARLSVANNGSANFSLLDSKGIVRAGLALLADGTPDFGLADSAGEVRIGIGFDKRDSSPALVFYERNKALIQRLP